MLLKTLLAFLLAFAFFACAPLKPVGPQGEFPAPPEQPAGEAEQGEQEKEDQQPDSAARHIINVGLGFEKISAKIECPDKKWEFRARAELGKKEIQSNGNCVYAGRTYRGNWTILSTDSGIAVINSLPMEDYLKGVVPHEIGRLSMDGFEALKAQAVAARTYAYSHLDSRRSQGFDVYADTRDQVYNGRKDEDSLANEAIAETNGLVIKHNGKLIEAFYHSTCGGKTESAEVWGQEPRFYLLSVPDSATGKAFCESSRYINWEERFTKAELAGLFQRNVASARVDAIFSFSKVEQVFITEKFPSGRIKRLVVFTDKGSFEVFGDRVRWLFQRNGKILPSAQFSIVRNGNNFSLKGSGFGHGIGMCQVGAINRAKEGQKFDAILKAYYSGVSVERY
jgi:stage II sporulation protein D